MLQAAEKKRRAGVSVGRPSADAVACALYNMVGHRLDTNIYHFDYRSDLTDVLCEAVGIDLGREVMTKAQINKVMSVVKKPRI